MLEYSKILLLLCKCIQRECCGTRWNPRPAPPLHLCCSSSRPDIFLHLQRRRKLNRICRAPVAKYVASVDGGSQLDYVLIAQNNQSLQTEVVPHHRNLERPSLAEDEESRGPLCFYCADSSPCWSGWGTNRIEKIRGGQWEYKRY